MIARLICFLFGHDPCWDQIQGVKIWRCQACWLIRDRYTQDVRVKRDKERLGVVAISVPVPLAREERSVGMRRIGER